MNNKTVVVTGGGRDIGRAISVRFAKSGANVVVNYNRSEKEAAETLEAVNATGASGIMVKADVTQSSEVKKLYEAAIAAFGQVDILVNNAGGIVGRKKLSEITEEYYHEVMDLNLKSTVLCCQQFILNMGSGSSVVNVSSLAARDGGGGGSAIYASSKGAVSTFTRSLSKEFGPEGIRVNAVCPGLIDTLFHDMFTPDEVRKKVAGSTPVRREGTSEDVAELVYFLGSDQSSFITGANYDINGGLAFS